MCMRTLGMDGSRRVSTGGNAMRRVAMGCGKGVAAQSPVRVARTTSIHDSLS